VAKVNETTENTTQTGRGNTFGQERSQGLGHPDAETKPVMTQSKSNPVRVTEVPNPGIIAPHN